MTKPRQSNAKARHQWRQIPRCACGTTAVKLLPGHEGICQRCLDIEQRAKSGWLRSQKFLATVAPSNCREKPLDVYYHPMPNFQ